MKEEKKMQNSEAYMYIAENIYTNTHNSKKKKNKTLDFFLVRCVCMHFLVAGVAVVHINVCM